MAEPSIQTEGFSSQFALSITFLGQHFVSIKCLRVQYTLSLVKPAISH